MFKKYKLAFKIKCIYQLCYESAYVLQILFLQFSYEHAPS